MTLPLLTESVAEPKQPPELNSIKIRYDVDWMKKYKVAGIVIGRTMMFAHNAFDVPKWLFRHELQHVYQIARLGVFRFYLMYFYYSLRHGYTNNPFEVEARKYQTEPLTEREEQLLWKSREGLMPLLKI